MQDMMIQDGEGSILDEGQQDSSVSVVAKLQT